MEEQKYELTQYAKGAGCGCKIAPGVLQEILHSDVAQPQYGQLLVGNGSNDDAAVYRIDEQQALISTTDFFTPIVDDAYTFGQVAAANAISDVYAMGGKPLMAVAILGWPVEKLPASLAREVIEGARSICNKAGIPLAGGHSIDITEPVFGLSVNGLVNITSLKQNNTAREGDLLFLTKPIGAGILATAQKRKVLQPEHYDVLVRQLTQLNNIGYALGAISGVTAMTDVTGFGLLGHLYEMATGGGLSAELNYNSVQVTAGVREYAAQRIIPDATYRNWNNYSAHTSFGPGVNVMEAFNLLPDPQTNGGLLIAVKEAAVTEVQNSLRENGYELFTEPVGRFIAKEEKTIKVI
ncbi:selenide, water dikinase SelD [Chitinophagaceae bacterium MMS25-I14]